MSNTNNRYLDGTEIKGNLTIQATDSNDGSIEVAGLLFVNEIREYDLSSVGVKIEDSIFYSSGNAIITSYKHVINSSSTDASLIINGGLLAYKDSKFDGILYLTNTTDSLDLSTGALQINSGVSIKKNINVGGVITLFNSVTSVNSSIGALISLGGISIQNSSDSISFTSGSALTILGGASVAKTLYANLINSNNTTISNLYNVNSSISNLYNTNSTLSNSNITNLNVVSLSSGNSLLTNVSVTNIMINNGSISNLYSTLNYLTNVTVNNLTVSVGNFENINATLGNYVNLTVGNLYVINNIEYNDIVTNLSTANIINNYSTIGSLYNIFSTIGSLFANNATISNLYNNMSTISNLYNTSITSSNIISINNTFTNLNNTFATIGNLVVNNIIPSYNSTTASIIILGGLSINNTTNSINTSSGGGITNAGGLSIAKDVYIAGYTYMYSQLDLNNNVITNVTSPSTNLQVANKYYVDNRFTNFTVGSVNGNFTQGQVIVGDTGGNIKGYSNFLYDGNLLSLYSTIDATSLSNGGTLSVDGGASIDKQLFVGGNAHILGYLDMNNQTIMSVATPVTPYDAANKYYVDNRFTNFTVGNVSGNFTQGQVIIGHSGGNIIGYQNFTFDGTLLSINSTVNAIGLGSGGSLTVNGGASILNNVYIGGILDVNNNVITNVTAPSTNLQVANKYYVDNQIASVVGQWTITSGNLSYTSGTVIVGGIISSGHLQSTTSTITNSVFTNISSGTINVTDSVFTNISSGTISATTSTIPNSVFTNISSGTISALTSTIPNSVFTNISSGTINVTDSVFTNISSGTISALTSTIPNSVFTNISSGTISALTSTIPNSVFTNISSGTISALTSTIPNSVFTNISSGTISALTSTIPNSVFTNISSGTISATTSTIPNSVFTNISSGTISALTSIIPNSVFTNISSGTINVTNSVFTNISSGTISALTSTIPNSVFTNISSGTISALTSTIPNSVFTNISSGTISALTSTIPNSVFTNISSGTISVLTSTIPNSVFTNISSGTISALTSTIPNSVFTNISSGTISATTSTIPNSVFTNISSGTISALTSTIPNSVFTNISSGTINVTDSVFTNISSGTISALTSTIPNSVFTNISSGTISALTSTIPNSVFTNISSGTISALTSTIPNSVFTNISSGTINVTDSVFTNISSGTISALTSTIPNSVFTNISSGTISTLTSTIPNSVFTNISSGTISATTSTIPNSVFTNISSGTISALTSTIPNSVFTNISSGTISALTSTIPNSVFTNISSGTISATTSTIPNSVFTNISSGTISATTSTIPNSVFTNISSGTISALTSTIPNSVFTNISSGTISALTSTIPNSVFTNISSGTISALTSTIPNSVFTNISSGTISATTSTIPNSVFTNISSGTISALTSTIPNSVFTNISSGTISATTSTIPNSVFTNISVSNLLSAFSANINDLDIINLTVQNILVTTTLNAIGIANTLGNLYTTGGNIGIGTTSPNYLLDIKGNVGISGYTTYSPISQPPLPSLSNLRLYLDTSGFLKSVNSAGNIKTYNPLTTKGDLHTFNDTTDVRLPVGITNQILYADSALSYGIGWKDLSTDSGVTDPNTTKYYEAYNTSNLLTLTNSYIDISLDTIRSDDVDTYSGLNTDGIEILRPGNYFIMYKLTCDRFSGTAITGISSVLSVSNTAGTYSIVPGSLSHALMINADGLSQTCNCNVILSLVPGQKIKLQAKKDFGTNTINVRSNANDLIIIRFGVDTNDNTKMFNGYSNTTTTLSGSFTDININVNRIIDTSNYTHTVNTSDVEILENGKYLILATMGFNKTSGTDLSLVESKIQISDTSGSNFTDMTGTLMYTFHTYVNITNSVSTPIIYNMYTGQKIKLQSKILSGSNIQSISDGVHLSILKIQSSSNGQNTVKFLQLYNTTNINIGISYTELTFNNFFIKDDVYVHTSGESQIEIIETGKYIILVKLCSNNSTANISSTQLRLLVDNGGGYSEIAGSLATCLNNITPGGTATIQTSFITDLAFGAKIKAQAIRLSGIGTLVCTTSVFTMLKLETDVPIVNTLIKFGTRYHYQEALDLSTTTSATFIQKLRLSTLYIPDGYYRIGVCYIVNSSTNNGIGGVRVQIDDSQTIHDNSYYISSNNANDAQIKYDVIEVHFSTGLHTVDIDFKSIFGTFNIYNVKIEVWRVR